MLIKSLSFTTNFCESESLISYFINECLIEANSSVVCLKFKCLNVCNLAMKETFCALLTRIFSNGINFFMFYEQEFLKISFSIELSN
jgi:hypothetical protein